MKTLRIMLPLLVVAAIVHTGCATTVYRPVDVFAESEDRAIARLGDDINTLGIRLLNKKAGVFNFTLLDWTASAAGKRISGRLHEYLEKKGKFRMVPRTELERILKNAAIEQAGMYDVGLLKKRSGAGPVDVVIYGTVENAGDAMEIMVRVVDVKTGGTLLVTGVRMPPTGEIATKANPDMLLLNRKSPEKIIAMNKTYYTLAWMKTRQPLVFLLVVLKDEEVKSLVAGSTLLGNKLKVRRERYKRERPEIMEHISALKGGLELIDRYARQRSSDISRWKKELLDTSRK